MSQSSFVLVYTLCYKVICVNYITRPAICQGHYRIRGQDVLEE